MTKVRPVTPADEKDWLRLRGELWPGSQDEHARDIKRFFTGESRNPLAVLLAEGEGKRIIGFAELWARSQHCSEFASDAEVNNETSIATHLAIGFVDRGVVRCFSKNTMIRLKPPVNPKQAFSK